MSISTVTKQFDSISLSQMDGVKLMNRTDRKFWFNIERLEEILDEIKDFYYILEINGERNSAYSTTYYDTLDDRMYTNHHRGKLNRFKIRRRSYISSQSSFLEVKFKSNKGRTIKKRISTPFAQEEFGQAEEAFVSQRSPYTTADLKAVLRNGFSRLMLVSKSMNERCTIDQNLEFFSAGVHAQLQELVIVEVKSEGRAPSKIIEAMHRRRIKSSGFSKYCIGRSITNSDLKHSLFKLKHKAIERHINTPITQLINTI